MINIKDAMLLKKVCDFYWYNLSIDGNKVEIINHSNKDFKSNFDSIEKSLKYFIDTMIDTDNESEDGSIWGADIINYIKEL